MMAGLFADPRVVQQQQEAARVAQMNQPTDDLFRGAYQNLGNKMGNGLIDYFNGPRPPSPEEQRARAVQTIAQQINFKDRNSIMNGVNALNQGGFQAEATSLYQMIKEGDLSSAPPVKRADQPHGEAYEKTITEGNSTRRVWVQPFITSEGNVYDKVIDAVTDKETEVTKKDQPVGEAYEKLITENGSTKRVWARDWKTSEGNIYTKVIDSVTDKATDTGPSATDVMSLKIPSGDLTLNPDSRAVNDLINAQVFNDPAFTKELFDNVNFDPSTEEGRAQRAAVHGMVYDLGNQYRALDLKDITQPFVDEEIAFSAKEGRPYTEAQATRRQQMLDDQVRNKTLVDTVYLQRAVNDLKDSGYLRGMVTDDWSGLLGKDDKLRFDPTDPLAIRQEAERIRAQRKAVADLAAKHGKPVFGNPDNEEFVLGELTGTQAKSVFNNMRDMNNEQMKEAFGNMTDLQGNKFQWTDELYNHHAKKWDTMRANPQAVALYMSYLDANTYDRIQDNKLLQSKTKKFVDDLSESVDVQGYADAVAIFNYLDRLQGKERPIRGQMSRHGIRKGQQ
jgi:hypothetical protein